MADVKVLNSVGATVIINGVEQEKVTVDYGSTVTWEVSKTGYVTQSGSQTVTEDTVLTVALRRETHTITIKVSPTDAKVTVNGTAYTPDSNGKVEITGKWGDELSWSVSKDGYDTKSGTYTVTDKDDTITVTLEESSPDTVTFSIEVTLED